MSGLEVEFSFSINPENETVNLGFNNVPIDDIEEFLTRLGSESGQDTVAKAMAQAMLDLGVISETEFAEITS